MEFDTTFNEPHVTGKRQRGADCDADGQRDDGVVNGVNVYGNGFIEFCRKLRAALGENKIIMADGSFRNEKEQRAAGLLNGIESEGWPNLQDKTVADWSGGLNRQAFWLASGHAPAISYINHKFNDPGAEDRKEKHVQVDSHITRLVFAGAVFTDSAITFMISPSGTGMKSSDVWDELVAGTENKAGWLGQPRCAAIHLASKTPDLLAIGGKPPGKQWIKRLASEDCVIETSAPVVKLSARNPTSAGFHVKVRGIDSGGPNLFCTVAARGAPMKNSPPEMARLLHASLVPADGSKPAGGARFMSWIGQKDFVSTFYFSDVGTKQVDLDLEIESAEPVWISSVTAHAAPDLMIREFTRGAVIANPSVSPAEFDLGTLFPGRSLRRLSGSASQDPRTNDGSAVAGKLTLAAKDALFLREK